MGGTCGFRALHLCSPHTGLIMAMGLNGLAADDQILALAETVYDTVLTEGLVHPLPATAGA